MDVILITGGKRVHCEPREPIVDWTHCKDENNECTFSSGKIPSGYENETQNQNRIFIRVLMGVLLERGVHVINCEPRRLIVD